MRWHLAWAIVPAMIALTLSGPAMASEWIFKRSRYTHDPVTGQRVTQYAAKVPSYGKSDPTFRESGFRHSRTVFRSADGGADRMHVVQEWGAGTGIRPYGEWQRPYRAGATPFGPWGNARGPWTTPFESWGNPYGLGQLRHPPWPHYESPYGYGSGYPGAYPPNPGQNGPPVPTPYQPAQPGPAPPVP